MALLQIADYSQQGHPAAYTTVPGSMRSSMTSSAAVPASQTWQREVCLRNVQIARQLVTGLSLSSGGQTDNIGEGDVYKVQTNSRASSTRSSIVKRWEGCRVVDAAYHYAPRCSNYILLRSYVQASPSILPIDFSDYHSRMVLSAECDVLLNRRNVLVSQSVNCFDGRFRRLGCEAFEEICVVLDLVSKMPWICWTSPYCIHVLPRHRHP